MGVLVIDAQLAYVLHLMGYREHALNTYLDVLKAK